MTKQRRARPRQHSRRLKSGKKIIVNKGVKKVSIGPYRRTLNKKSFKVKGHKRGHRKLGKKIRYKDVGRFQVAFDEFGNFRGSRIIKPKKKKKLIIKRKRLEVFRTPQEASQAFFTGKINQNEWLDAQKRLRGLR